MVHPSAPVDVVDRPHRTRAALHGTTWQRHVDAFLDEISRRDHERQAALDALTALIRRRPDLERDPDVTTARLALLR